MTSMSTDPVVTQESDGNDGDANAQLRAYADRLKAENKQLRAQAMSAHIEKLGLKTDEGLGVAIVEGYDGDVTYESIAQWAQEKYKHTPPEPITETDTQAQAIDAAHQQLDAANASSSPVIPDTQQDTLAKHDQRLHEEDAGRSDAISAIADKTGVVKQLLQ